MECSELRDNLTTR